MDEALERNRVYSKAYHRAAKEAELLKKPMALVKKLARAAGQAAVSQM